MGSCIHPFVFQFLIIDLRDGTSSEVFTNGPIKLAKGISY